MTTKPETPAPFKERVFYVLLDRLADLEAAQAEGFDVQEMLDEVHAVLRLLPTISVLPRLSSEMELGDNEWGSDHAVQ